MTTLKLHELDFIEGNDVTVKVIERVASEWEKVATRLHFDGPDIRRIRKDNHFQCIESCRAVFIEWIKGKGRHPATWQILIKVLREADLSEVASDLEFVLGILHTE